MDIDNKRIKKIETKNRGSKAKGWDVKDEEKDYLLSVIYELQNTQERLTEGLKKLLESVEKK